MTSQIVLPPSLSLFVRWPAAHGASFSSGIDDAARTIRVTGGGIWRRPDAHRYFDHQRRIVEEARRRYGPLKVSFDVRRWIVENEESALQFCDMNAELYRADDRLAALVECSALKKHPRTALGVGNRASFISGSAAELWLHAYTEQA